MRREVEAPLAEIKARGLHRRLTKRLEREIAVFARQNKIKVADVLFERAPKQGKALAK